MLKDKTALVYVALVAVSALAIGAMSLGLYHQQRDIERIQAAATAEREDLCRVLSEVSATLDRRTVPIRTLLVQHAKIAREGGDPDLAALLTRYTSQIDVPPTIACPDLQ
jgi:glutamate 5-kinase